VLGGVGSGGQLSIHGGLGKHPGIRDQGLDVVHHPLHGLHQIADLVIGILRELDRKVPLRHLVGNSNATIQRLYDATTDEISEKTNRPEGQRGDEQRNEFRAPLGSNGSIG